MKAIFSKLIWLAVALAGAMAYVTLALHRGEKISSAYILIAALCSYAIGYRFYSKWIATRILLLNDRRATPSEVHDDGKDFVKTNKWIVFGHHFAAISGPGPLVGPVLAAQFGYLPSALWILIGVVLGGAVQDLVILFCSMRRDGKSLAQMIKEELNTTAGVIGVVGILAIMIILLAVLALVVVNALADSPWGVFTVGATIPIAMFMGGYMRFIRIGKVMEASAIGVVLLLLAVWGGKIVYADKEGLALLFKLPRMSLAWAILIYGFAASVLPVWLLLAPRDYLSTFMKLGTIFALACGVFLVLPELKFPAVSKFIDGTGLIVPGGLFPFCFITIACGSISGFHTLIASGTTPKLITRENYARSIGYGAMLLESLVAIMALVAACTLEPGIYLGMNVAGTPAATVMKVNEAGFALSEAHMNELARQVGEDSLFNRAGGAATLAVGMAQIFSKVVGRGWLDLWYHFAIMFEALFILTTLDAGTRVGRYLLQDMLGNLWKPLGHTRKLGPNLLASLLIVAGWGFFLIQGVRDPEGGIRALWPLFGIANQMLAAIALCLATTVILKMQLAPGDPQKTGRPLYALVTLVPLIFLLAVTTTASMQKIFHPKPNIGFLAKATALNEKLPTLEQAVQRAEASGDTAQIATARKAVRLNRVEHFNQIIDAIAAAVFLVLVTAIAFISVREWILLLARKRLAQIHETPPVWLPEYALVEGRPLKVLGLLALAVALARELSGEAQFERAKHELTCAHCQDHEATLSRSSAQSLYVQVTEERYTGKVNRCC